ncbi:MAG: MFS transporter [Acidobacteriota bacterium]|nr:MFS transporter [Acidobacteriota bacterium]
MTVTALDPARSESGRSADWRWAGAALFVCGWGGNQFTPLLDLYRSVNGWSATVVNALLGAYVFGLIPALLLGGGAARRFGRKGTVSLAVLSSVLGSCLIAAQGLGGVAVGRLFSGVGVGLAMAVGTSWTTELSVASGASPQTGAKRAALSLTAGFGLGAGVAGVLAQWGPWPESLPYAVQVVLGLSALGGLRRVDPGALVAAHPFSSGHRRGPHADQGAPLGDRDRRRRFKTRVLPMAPWVFGTSAVAYAIVPQALAPRLGHHALIFATVLTVVTLGAGMLTQPLARRLDHPVTRRAPRSAMALVVAGLAIAAVAVATDQPIVALGAAAVLGAGYGMSLLSGLLEVQRIAPPGRMVAATGAFYSLAYAGFLLPALLASLAHAVPVTTELIGLTVIAAVCTAVIWRPRERTSLGAGAASVGGTA